MPKKQITGESKLLTRANQIDEPINEPIEKLPLVSPKKPEPKMKNYRLKETDLERLNSIIENVNQLRPIDEPVTEIAVIKALLLMGSRTKPEQMLKTIREVM